MVDQYKYWNSFPTQIDECEFLKQVGRTVDGEPIPDSSVTIIVNDLVSKFDIGITDLLLDLCCGNGLITAEIASYCHHITAIDFSEPLIKIANGYFSRHNISYVIGDVRRLPDRIKRISFTKIVMNSCVQHFDINEIRLLFESLKGSASSSTPIFLTSIPDRLRLWNFYNTPERRAEYRRRMQDKTEAIGTWWSQQEFSHLAAICGYKARFFDQNPNLDTAHYRFDALLIPSK